MSKEFDTLKELKHWKETNTEKGVTWLPVFVVEDVEQALLKAQEQEKALNILKPDLRLVGNFLQARMPLVDEADLWVFVKEITNKKELELLKKILGQTEPSVAYDFRTY